jgi:SET domain-containing protein
VQIQLYVGPSRIAGQGLFAAQDIPQGARVIAYIGEKISTYESVRRRAAGNAYIFHLNYRFAIDGQMFDHTARYINHSCDPNCTVEKMDGTLWVVAIRDITAGEELSFNYGYELTHYCDNPCTCGTDQCCGYILAQQYWGRIAQQ